MMSHFRRSGRRALGAAVVGSLAVMTCLRSTPPARAGDTATTRPAANSAAAGASVLTWGDQGDGTYRNPILNADYSDPDVIRVGDDFYLVASDFHFVGMQILHSKDLVNWRLIGQVFHRLAMDPKYDRMKGYGQGTWAPSLRYHDGQFYLFVCTPGDGLFMWHTRDPAGPWSDMVTVKQVAGWENPCPLWDDDGNAYLVHSHKGAGPLILHKMKPDGTALLDDGTEIYRGPNSEGPKLYKRHGYYYISLPEGGVMGGGQTLLRARNLYGPWERREVLVKPTPHQGGMVELDHGQAWFIGFKFSGFLGRVCWLEPVQWQANDWPVFGDNGKAVEGGPKPAIGQGSPIQRPATSDDFASPTLALQWQWNHNPVNTAWSLTDRRGWLRLSALPAEKIVLARNTLTQKLYDHSGRAGDRFDVSHLGEGDRCGFTFLGGTDFNDIGVVHDGGQNYLEWKGTRGPAITGDNVWLGGEYDGPAATLSYSSDGSHFTNAPVTATLKFGNWKGARVGLFCYGPGGGSAEVTDFRYRYAATTDAVGS